jgi:glycosyltransferase involved in cell wall biosynthesis
MPKVSVCIPNYNYGIFIEDAIKSVLDQTFKDFELIIIDDCSTDNSVEIIKRFTDPRIKFIQNKRNIGRIKNINKILSMARADFITLLPADSYLTNDSLEKRVEILEKDKEIGLVFSAVYTIDENKKIIEVYRNFSYDWIREGKEIFEELILNNYIITSSVMVRKECYKKLGFFDEGIAPRARDWEMWLRIALNNYKIAFISTPIIFERLHQKNITHYFEKENLIGMGDYEIIKGIFYRLPKNDYYKKLENKAVRFLSKRMLVKAAFNLLKGNSKLARKNILFALTINNNLFFNPLTIFLFGLSLTGKLFSIFYHFINKSFLRKLRKIFIKI